MIAHFTIWRGATCAGRSARPARRRGPMPCVVAALSDVRTEAAPDVGDVEVTVRIAFVVKT